MAPSQDLFSLLPEALIITILSLLPIKEAVRTSILAKPWRYLWCLRPIIEINQHLFCTLYTSRNPLINSDPAAMQCLDYHRQYCCLAFGFRWLLTSTIPSTISSCILAFSNPQHCSVSLKVLIFQALSLKTKSLQLDFSSLDWEGKLPITYLPDHKPKFELPVFVYRYNSLESLKLVSCDFKGIRFKVLGLSLKSVFLGWIEIKNKSKLRNLVSRCPVLESLSLFKCFGSTVYVIESESLKTLIVDKCVDLLHLDVDAPNLTSFKYCGTLVHFGIRNFPILETAELDFGLVGMFDEEDCDRIAYLIYHFRRARSLTVCNYITQILSLGEDVLPYLPERPIIGNLTIKSGSHVSEFSGILHLLDTHPLLEKLHFEFGQRISFEEDMMNLGIYTPITFWSEVNPSEAGCVTNKLKVVEVTGFRGTPNEVNVLTFLLSYGVGMQALVLRLVENDEYAIIMAMGIKRTLVILRPDLKVVIISCDGIISDDY